MRLMSEGILSRASLYSTGACCGVTAADGEFGRFGSKIANRSDQSEVDAPGQQDTRNTQTPTQQRDSRLV